MQKQTKLQFNTQRWAGLRNTIRQEYENLSGIVIADHSQILFEDYFILPPEQPIHVASVTKSVLSALIGVALDQNWIASLDQKIIDFFPEIPETQKTAGLRQITIRNLLTMTVSYSWKSGQEPLEALTRSADWIQFALSQVADEQKPGMFQYSTMGAHLLSAILSRTSGRSARELANEYVLKPAGMTLIPDHPMSVFNFDTLFGKDVRGWVHDPAGNSAGGWGLTMTARDMARFGQIYLNQGCWNQKQILPPSWVSKSWADTPFHYGFLWWQIQDHELRAAAAIGDGGNMICCLPEQGLVVALNSLFSFQPKDRWELIRDQLLPLLQ